jgi:hypothetical protein
MTAQAGMPQQMHPDFYMMQNQSGQQRVPPMHMAPSQMQQVSKETYFLKSLFKSRLFLYKK